MKNPADLYIKIIILTLYVFTANILYADSDMVEVEFSFESVQAENVSVAGSFNNWSAENNVLEKNGSVWRVILKLEPGYYYYKLVVDGNWIPDPANPERVNDGSNSFNSILKVGEPPVPVRKNRGVEFPKERLPIPVLEENPEWVELYYTAWQMAWNKIMHGTPQNGFVESFMDEGFNELIFQWDTCFMMAFGIYGRNVFPVMPSLDNFYRKQRADGYIQRVYWESNGEMATEPNPDEQLINPPLFAWLELRYYRITGDDSRLVKVLPILIKYYNWIDNNCRTEHGKGLYYNTPLGSGMDNLPRPEVGKAGWIDFSAQQALAAKSIYGIAEILGETDITAKFQYKYMQISSLINGLMWDEERRFYFDMTENGNLSSIKHIGAFWVLLAEVAPPDRSDALLHYLQDPKTFWRPHPVPTLAANESAYDPRGHYWLGGVWAPTNYMVVRGLEKYNKLDLARQIARNHLRNIADIYSNFMPAEENIAFEERYADNYHTIWECYSPELPQPATRWDNTFYSRQDFVGWSGLGPIAMLIENIIGLEIIGSENTIRWQVTRSDRHGLKNFLFKDQVISLVCKPNDESLEVWIDAKLPFQLEITWEEQQHRIEVNQSTDYLVLRKL